MKYNPDAITLVEHVYYANARMGGKTAVLAGPFITAPEAEMTLDVVGPRFCHEEPNARVATFGVMEVKAPGMGPGRYNAILPDNMLMNLAIDTGIRSN